MPKRTAKALAPIEIPQRSPWRAKDASRAANVRKDGEHSRGLAIAASAVLVALVVMEIRASQDSTPDVREWSFWVFRLVFPSQQVTWIKIVCLILGFVLTTSYFLSSQAQLATAEKLMIHSASLMVSPLRRHQQQPTTNDPIQLHQQQLTTNDPDAPTPTGKTTAAWLASHCHSLFHDDHFDDSSSQPRGDAEIPQLKILDECRHHEDSSAARSPNNFEAVNRPQPLAFESEYFKGHVHFMVKDSTRKTAETDRGKWSHLFTDKKRLLWVQVQGRFKRPLPPRTAMFLATELPNPDGFQVAFLTRQLVSILITVVKKMVPTAHISFGIKTPNETENELPHAAFPLYQTVDEFVITEDSENGKLPSFGEEVFGESLSAKKLRVATPVGMEPEIRVDAVYSFQFYTMYSDLAQWRVVNIPGMPDMDLKRFCGMQPIRIAAYNLVMPGLHPGVLSDLPHKHKDKGYVFCFSMHHDSCQSSSILDGCASHLLIDGAVLPTKSEAVSRPPISPLRWRSISCDQPAPVARQRSREANGVLQTREQSSTSTSPMMKERPQPRIRASSSVRNMSSFERATDLSNWKFSLPVWIERVDPAAGNRKVGYLFVVEEKRTAEIGTERRCVLRSAQTVKNALFLQDVNDSGERPREFRKLIVESREFLYDAIGRETEQVARALQDIAALSADEATEADWSRKAMLFNCLMSESEVPCVRSYQEIGVQLTKAKRDQMDIIFEKGIYRMLDPRFLRQEWFVLTTNELNFFRSYTLKPSKTIHLSHVLSIKPVDNVPFFENVTTLSTHEEFHDNTSQQPVQDVPMRSTNRWFCVEIHSLNEVLTLFFDSSRDRALCISSLAQLIKLKFGGNAGNISGRLPKPRSIETLSMPVSCNQRRALSARSPCDTGWLDPIKLAEELVELGVRIYNHPREEVKGDDVVSFLEAAERFSAVNLRQATSSAPNTLGRSVSFEPDWCLDDKHRISFALNLFHALYIHAWLLFGEVTNHLQWRKLKTVVYYTIGDPRVPSAQFRLTLADIEFGLLKGHHGPNDEQHRELAKNFPTFLITTERDFRTSFVLQTTSSPQSLRIIRPYRPSSLDNDINEACASYLANEVAVDTVHRVIQLPKVCEWNAEDFNRVSPPVQIGSPPFFCLQKLLPLMRKEQHDKVQHLLLGAVKECQIRYSARFWTQETQPLSRTVLFSPSGSVQQFEGKSTTGGKSQTSDDSSLSKCRSDAPQDGGGMPRSKSALEFLQSFF